MKILLLLALFIFNIVMLFNIFKNRQSRNNLNIYETTGSEVQEYIELVSDGYNGSYRDFKKDKEYHEKRALRRKNK